MPPIPSPTVLNRNRSPRIRAAVGLAAATAGLLSPALLTPPEANAASVETGNACFYSFDNYYRDLAITLDGAATPNPLPAGEKATLTATFSGSMPDWIPTYGYNYGLLHVGQNQIPTKIWLALEGIGSIEGTQVVEVVVDAVTTVEDPDGTPSSGDEDGTPPTVSIDLPPTTWTSTGGAIELRQASGGSLPLLPGAGPDGQDVTPQGSAFIAAQLSDLTFDLDCQPGEYDAATRGETFIAAEAEPFDVVEVGTAPPSTETEKTTTTSGVAASPSDTTTAVPDASDGSSFPIGIVMGGIAIVLAALGAAMTIAKRKDKAVDPDPDPNTDPAGPGSTGATPTDTEAD